MTFDSGIPECWLVIAEGDGKATMVAALALHHAKMTPDALVPVAASLRGSYRLSAALG